MATKVKNLSKPLTFPSVANHQGSILILALWTICMLTSFAIILSSQVRHKIILVRRLDEIDKLHFIAEAGVQDALARLKEEPQKTYHALKDAWSNNINAFKDISVGDGKFNVCYNYLDVASGSLEVRYGLVDEESKININKMGLSVLKRLFQIALGFDEVQAQELAASIIDWRDSDSELTIPLGSAEDSYYRNLPYPYEAKDAEFEVLEEALLVKNMTQDVFEKIKDYITIYGNGKVNINTASKVALLALGLSEDLVDKIISFRCGEDKISGTKDDNVFDAPANIVTKLSQSLNLSDADIAQLGVVIDQYLVSSSDIFMIRSVAGLDGRKSRGEVIAVVNQEGKVLYWRES